MCVCSTIASAPRSRRAASRPAHRDEVERPVQVGLAGGAQAKSQARDRRREPVVEATCQAQPRRAPRPSPGAARARARAACARGTARTSRPSRSARGTAPRTPARRYSCTCHGLSERGAPRGREREHVRRGDEHRSAFADERAEVLEHRAGILEVLDRLQEHDRVGRLGEVLDEIALEAQVRAACSAGARARGPRGWHRPRRRSPRAREHVGAVALAAGHVDRRCGRASARRSTRTRRDGGETSSSPRGRPAACARPSAPAAGRRRAGRADGRGRERNPCAKLMSRDAFCRYGQAAGARRGHGARVYGAAPCRPLCSAEEIRDANTRYHDVAADHYDSKWGIDFGEIGCRQVTAKVRKALGREPARYARSLEIGAGTGYFTLNLLRRRDDRRRRPAATSRPACWQTLQQNAAQLGLEVRTETADAEQLPFADESFDLVLGHAVLHHIPDLERAFAEFERVLAPGGTLLFAGEPSRYGDRLAAVPKRAASTSRRCGAARSARQPPERPTAEHRTLHWRAWSTCTRSRPPSSPGSHAAPASRRCASAARSCWPTGSGGPTARWRRRPSPMTCRGHGVCTPTAATCCCRSSTAGCSSRACRAAIFYNLMLAARKPAAR